MCIRCHSNLSDDYVYNDLYNTLHNNPNYEIFNSTSISHLHIAALNYNGEKVKKIAIELLENFSNWAIINKKNTFNSENILKTVKNKHYTKAEAYNLLHSTN